MRWIRQAGFRLARALIALRVKLSISPQPISNLDIDQNQPIFYLIETRSLANLLAIDHACVQLELPRPMAPLALGHLHLGYSVAAVVNWRRDSDRASVRPSGTLTRLVHAALAEPTLDVQLLPVTVIFGRRPDREHGLFKLLFSDHSKRIGRWRKFLIVLLHGHNTWVQFNRPVRLRDFIDQSQPTASDTLITRKLGRLFRVHFRHRRTAMIGPELSDRDTLIHRLLRSQAIADAVRAEVERSGVSPGRALDKARRYAYEIAANLYYPFLIFMRRALRRVWNRLYDGIELNHAEALAETVAGKTAVYLPCHRSHIDYLLLSYLLDAQGLAVPHVAAGVNLNIPVIGTLLRRGGAFFLRRSFRGRPLYQAVFHAYYSALLHTGFSVEFFVEGGRSRTGLMRPPRSGMLDMTVRSFLSERGRPIVVIPVYIGYEKLVEGNSYFAELAGAKKQKESLRGFFSSLNALRREFGRVHVNFGEPLDLQSILDTERPDWRAHHYRLAERPDWLPATISGLNRQIVTRINSAVAVNGLNLLAVLLLSTPRYAMGEGDLYRRLDLCRALLRRLQYSTRITISGESGRTIVDTAIRLDAIERHAHPLGPIISIRDDDPNRLRYFANNVLHVFALPGVVACALKYDPDRSQGEIRTTLRLIYPYLAQLLYLPWPDDEIDAVIDRTVNALIETGLVGLGCADTAGKIAPGGNGETTQLAVRSAAMIELLAQSVAPIVERFFLAVALLLRCGSNRLSEAEFDELYLQVAQRFALLYAFKTTDFVDQAVLGQVLSSLREQKLIAYSSSEKLVVSDQLNQLNESIGMILSPAYRADLLEVTELVTARASTARSGQRL